ncbi:MAG: threonine/serine exporter family protein [Lachnospiraceae bacterium]|nr:threonine/serine exporter family protein [Lachnospiraceae bacterium]
MNNTIYNLMLNFAASFIAIYAFAILYNAPRKELIPCAITGAFGWIVYFLVMKKTMDVVISTFFGAVTVAACSRMLSYTRCAPSTLFLIPGILPLVPGTQIYNTMKAVIADDLYLTFQEAVKAFKLAGVIAVGIIIVFSLPYKTFALFDPKEK